MQIRNISPNDYQPVINVLDEWWDGRRMSDMLPKLFFIHFCETSFIAEFDQNTIGFLIGFLSQTHLEEAYIHFAGIHPEFRQQGVGKSLYQQFFQTVQKLERKQVRCVTSPVNKNSIEFHLKMGFKIQPSETEMEGIPYHLDYDGRGEDRVLLVKHL